MYEPNVIGALAALGSAASWAVGAFLFKALGEILSPLAMTLAKGVSSIVLLGVAVALVGPSPIGIRPAVLLAASGLLGIALGDTFFFRALQGLTPLSLLVLAVVGQVLTVLMAVAFLREALSAGAAVGIVLVLIGVTGVLRGTTTGDEGRGTRTIGVAYGLLAVVCMAASSVIAKAGLSAGAGDTVQATFIRMLAGTLGVFCFGAAAGQVTGWLKPFRDRKLAARFVSTVAVVTFGGFWLGMVAFNYTSVAVASTLTSTEPAFALVIGVLVFRERVRLLAVVGTAVTFAGVVLLSVPEAAPWLCGLLRAA